MTAVTPDRPLPFRSILVTGADGFVSGKLIRRLAALAPDARLTLCARGSLAAASGVVVPLDLTCDASVARVIADAQPDLVVHLAAQASVALSAGLGSTSGALSTWSINVAGSMRLASALAELARPATVLFASSAEVYGLTFNEGCLDETAVRRPQSVYARSKAAAEDALADMLPAAAQLIVARPCNHSGPGQDGRFVLPSFAEQIAAIELGRREPVLRVGNLESERDFLHVDDVVEAYLKLIAAAPALPTRAIFNVASGKPVAIGDMLAELLAQSSAEIVVKTDPARLRPQEVPHVCILADKLREATGWQPVRTRTGLLHEILAEKRQCAATLREP